MDDVIQVFIGYETFYYEATNLDKILFSSGCYILGFKNKVLCDLNM